MTADWRQQGRCIVAMVFLWSPGLSDAGAQTNTGELDNPVAAHQLDRLASTLEKPLFSPKRRPPVISAVAVVHPPEETKPIPRPDLALFGIIMDTRGRRAIVRIAPPERMAQLRVGDEVARWRVTRIEQKQLVLSCENRSASFELFGSEGTHRTAKLTSPPLFQMSEKLDEARRAVQVLGIPAETDPFSR